MLESYSFWSFIPASVLSKMLIAGGKDVEITALKIWSQAANRTRIACGSLFKYVDTKKDSPNVAQCN